VLAFLADEEAGAAADYRGWRSWLGRQSPEHFDGVTECDSATVGGFQRHRSGASARISETAEKGIA